RQPVDADVDVRPRLVAAGEVEVASARRAAADEHGVVALAEQRLHGIDTLPAAKLDAQIQDVTDFFIDHRFGQTEFGNLAADHAARLRVAIEYGDLVTQWRQVTRHGERGRPGSDASDALAIVRLRRLGQEMPDVVLVVGRDALQAADGDRLLLRSVFHPAAPARR